MPLNQNEQDYYSGFEGRTPDSSEGLGYYRFLSLEDVVNNYIVLYGDDESTHGGRAMRRKVEAYAQRSLQEFSYDTLAVKSLEYQLSNSARVPLPQDFVELVGINWVNQFGIEQWLVPRKDSANPRSPQQLSLGQGNITLWTLGSAYSVGARVAFNGIVYEANAEIAAGATATPLANNNWTVVGDEGDYLFDSDGNLLYNTSSVTRDRYNDNTDGNNPSSSNLSQYATTTGGFYTYGKRYYLDTETVSRAPSYYISLEQGIIDIDPVILQSTNGSIISTESEANQEAVITMKYISDGLGSDFSEIQVHKFIEEAMYDKIYHNMIARKSNVPANEKERARRKASASERNAKIRFMQLSPREITQTLRTQARWIKT